MLLGAIALVSFFSVSGCQNPLDPIDKSDKIQGLTWFEINGAELDRWDSDPELDGMLISLSYKNEFGDELSFHDKPHNVFIEFWTQKDIGTGGNSYLTRDQLFFSKTIRFENSDDSIRIPIEAYIGPLGTVFDLTDPDADFTGMLVVRVQPPQEYPRPELLVAEADVVFYERPVGDDLTP
ncbi:MAG TPA: hypothetical protein VN317_01990 [Candidatus Methanoperedens sp.]|nr:hypothetical protein [Candidatus Methanoperedens sp.]